MANKDGSYNTRVNEKRYRKLKESRLQLLIKTEEEIKISDIVGHLIDNYLDEAEKDISEKSK